MPLTNIFDDLAVLTPPEADEIKDKLDHYLSTDPEHTTNVLVWWLKQLHLFLNLGQMALDYHTIPGMSLLHELTFWLIPWLATCVHIEWVFSNAWILLSHIHNQLLVQSTHALLCIGAWSLLGYVKTSDIKGALSLHEEKGGEGDDDVEEGGIILL